MITAITSIPTCDAFGVNENLCADVMGPFSLHIKQNGQVFLGLAAV